MGTRTGNIPIGFRRGGTDWQKDLDALASWSKNVGFEAVDLGGGTSAADVETLARHGLRLGSVDLADMGGVMSTDAGKQKESIARSVEAIRSAAAIGAKAFFCVVIPHDSAARRKDNYRLAVDAFAPLAHAAHAVGASLAIEGYPGGGPHYPAICCTPETVRTFAKDIGPGFGLNYDPSHLIRLGVDHIRFLKEFLPHVKHAHAKDTELDGEALYEFGSQQSATFAPSRGFGQWVWRYTLPGMGVARWTEICRLLSGSGYDGMLSVELEDENFNGTETGEKAGLGCSLSFLRTV